MPHRNRGFELEEVDWSVGGSSIVEQTIDIVHVPATATQQMMEAAQRRLDSLMSAQTAVVEEPAVTSALTIETIQSAMQALQQGTPYRWAYSEPRGVGRIRAIGGRPIREADQYIDQEPEDL